MELKPGIKVIIKTYEQRPAFWNTAGLMDEYMGRIATLARKADGCWHIEEDDGDWLWQSEDFIILPVNDNETRREVYGI